MVFPFSTHNDLLRDWLARSGIDLDRDVRLKIALPPRMRAALSFGYARRPALCGLSLVSRR